MGNRDRAIDALGSVLAVSCADGLVDDARGDIEDTGTSLAVTSAASEGSGDGGTTVSYEGTTGSTTRTEAEGTSGSSTTAAGGSGDTTGSPAYPIAEEDRYVVRSRDLPLVVDAAVGVLANDEAGDGGPLAVTDVDTRTSTSAVIDVSPDGSFTYSAPEGFSGTDRFAYTVTHLGHGGTDTSRIRIVVVDTER